MSLFKYFIIKIFVKVEFDICGVWAEGGGVGSVTLWTTNQELKLKLYPERKCCKLLQIIFIGKSSVHETDADADNFLQ